MTKVSDGLVRMLESTNLHFPKTLLILSLFECDSAICSYMTVKAKSCFLPGKNLKVLFQVLGVISFVWDALSRGIPF